MSDRRLQILKDLGFASYPARAYLALRDQGPSTARSVAHTANIPVGKIYTALRYLIERDLVEERAGRPQTYIAASLQRYLDPQRARFDLALSEIEGIKTEGERRSSSSVLEILLGRVQQAVVVAEVGGAIESWNKASSRLFGYGEDEARHLRLEALVAPAMRAHLALYLGLLDPTGPNPRTEAMVEAEALTRRGDKIRSRFELLALPSNDQRRPRVAMLVQPIDAHQPPVMDAQEHAGGFAVVRAGEIVHWDHRFLRLTGHSDAPSVTKPSRPQRAPVGLHHAIAHVLREREPRPGGLDASEQYTGALVRHKGDPIPVELAIRPAALPGGSVVLLVRELVAK